MAKQLKISIVPTSKRVHITARGKSWSVRNENATRATKIFNTKEEALTFTKNFQNKDVIVHKKDGTISKWIKSNDK